MHDLLAKYVVVSSRNSWSAPMQDDAHRLISHMVAEAAQVGQVNRASGRRGPDVDYKAFLLFA